MRPGIMIFGAAALIVAAGAAAWWISLDRGPPPEFRRPGEATLREMVSQPPSYAYGSSINVFVYRSDDNAIKEIAILGHADSDTCSRASGAVAEAIFEKPRDPQDFFIAGAGRLVAHEDPARLEALRGDANVLRYEELKIQLTILDVQRRLAPDNAANLNAETQKIEAEIALLEQNQPVQEFRKVADTQDSMQRLFNRLQELSQDTGLVVIHEAPYSLMQRVSQRISELARSGKAQVFAFSDLLDEEQRSDGNFEAAMALPMLMLAGDPLHISYPDNRLTSEAFETASKVNQSELEFAMIGDAKNRLIRQKDQLSEYTRQIEDCERLAPAQLAEDVILNETCTDDGCFKSDKPETMSQEAYCKSTLPSHKTGVEGRIKITQEQIAKIEADRKEGGGKIDAMNLSTLIDSMLRDWALPVGRSQEAFDAWRRDERVPAWQSLRAALRSNNVAPEAIKGEAILFQVARDGDKLVVNPYHVIDVRRSALVIDPRAGVTQVIDTWGYRSFVSSKAPPKLADLLTGSVNGGAPLDVAVVADALGGLPRDAVAQLLATYAGQFANRTGAVGDRAHLAQIVEMNEYFEQSSHLDVDLSKTTTEEEEWEQMRNLSDLARLQASFGRAPPEHEIQTAVMAVVFAFRSLPKEIQSRSDELGLLNALVDSSDGKAELSKQLRDTLAVLSSTRGFDAREIVSDAIKRARASDPEMVAYFLNNGKTPDRKSARLAEFIALGNKAQSLSDEEFSLALKAERMLKSQSFLAQASDRLFDTEPDLDSAMKSIDVASEASAAAAYGPAAAAKQHIDILMKTGNRELLSRLEAANLLDTAGQVIRTRYEVGGGKDFGRISTNYDEFALSARIMFDAGQYSKAVAALFPVDVPLAMSDNKLKIEILDKELTGPIDEMLAQPTESGEVLVSAVRSGIKTDLVRLGGLPPERAQVIAEAIAGVPSDEWLREYALVEQIERKRVPLSPEQSVLRTLFTTDQVRMALLKAIVYGCAAPRVDLAPLAGRCGGVTRKRFDAMAADASVTVEPAKLDQLVADARARLEN